METPLVPQVLLQHGRFVRALARSLLRDGHAAEDVAQETWTRYFERQPADEHGLRAWLRVVVRNLAVNRGRREQSLAARERATARPEALPGADAELEHAELLGAVVGAVLALEEPYRTTIVARYYRGLDPERIAAESGTSAATVRSREHRALEKLREGLDRRSGNERRVWAAVLARVAGPPEGELTAPPPAPWATDLGVVVPVFVAVVAAVVWFYVRTSPGTSLAAPVQDAETIARFQEEFEPLELVPPSRVPEPMRESVEQGVPPTRELAVQSSLAEVRGRFVFTGGAPAVGVPVEMHGWKGNQELVLQFGMPEDWVDPQAETDDDGRFALRFDPPRAFQFTLGAKAPGHAEASWRWSEIQPRATLDLGEVELPVGGTIEGRMVDEQGNPLVGEEWMVYARTVGFGEGHGRDDSQVMASVDSDTASFRLQDVWPSQVQLQGYSHVANWIDGPLLDVRSGEAITADIVYSGPSNARRITVVTFCDPFYAENPAQENIRLIGPSGETRASHWIEDSSQSFSFDDLMPGTYSIEIDDPNYLPWSRAGVTPGQRIDAHITGSAALRLSVIDAAGQAVERYSVRVTLKSSEWQPNEFELHDDRTPLAGGLLRGMLPGDYTVAIRGPDGATARCEVDGLRSGETRAVRLDLGRQLFVAGRVVHDGGEGVAEAEVLLLSPAEQDDSDASPILEQGTRTDDEAPWRKQLGETTTSAEGGFRFDVTDSGPFVVRARSNGSQAFTPAFLLESTPGELVLVLPRPGSVRGRVRAPAGADFSGLALWIAPAAVWDSGDAHGLAGLLWISDMGESASHAVGSLGSDGGFVLEHLPPGPSRAFLVIAESVAHGYGLTEDGITGAQGLGDVVVPAGSVLERDFDAPELPGWIALDLRVNREPAPSVELTLRGADQVGGRTDSAGHFGPKRVQSGSWSVWAQDRRAGWAGPVPGEIRVEPGREAQAILDVQVIRGTITCVDSAGRPLAGETVTALLADDSEPEFRMDIPVTTRKTDANGQLALQLLAGEYSLQRGPYDPTKEPAPPTVPLTWTASGPLQERVQL